MVIFSDVSPIVISLGNRFSEAVQKEIIIGKCSSLQLISDVYGKILIDKMIMGGWMNKIHVTGLVLWISVHL